MTETNNVISEQPNQPQTTTKNGRKKKVIPETLVIEKPEEETISYTKAEKMTRVKRGMSDKQKENILKLIEMNKQRRQAKLDAELKAKELEEAKLKQKVVRVLPKRKMKVKETPKMQREEEEESSASDDDRIPAPSESEGTKKVRKNIKKLQSITTALDNLPKLLQPQSNNPYLNILKLSGF